jgi:50S ribosomal protein L4/50S ribosomal protein uL3
MVSGLIGRKLGMTQIFGEDGRVIPVTVVAAGPCVVVQRKTRDGDGYEAVQLGFVEKISARRVTRPRKGHFDKAGVPPCRVLREFAPLGGDEIKVGDTVGASLFQEKDYVDVTGRSRGKGFAGVIKRHHFRGGAASHGSMFHRAPGSIGSSAFPIPGVQGHARGRPHGRPRLDRQESPDRPRRRREQPHLPAGSRARGAAGVPRDPALEERVAKMTQVQIRNLKNKELRAVELPEAVFGYPKRPHLVYEAVLHYLAEGRAGTHATKNRSFVSGGGKKPWKQKKTGRSRHGSIRSPLWRGGGTVQGPKPHLYGYAFPRQMRWNALRSVLSEKAREGRLILVDGFELGSHRTKDLTQVLEKLGLEGTKTLLVDTEINRNLDLAARNLQGVQTARASGLNVPQVLHHDVLVLSESALSRLTEWLAP